MSRSGLDPSRQWAVIYNFTKGAVEFYSSSGYSGTNPRTGSAMPVSDTNWHHIAYRHSGGNWSGYLDGERIFSIASPFQLSTINNNLYIGGTVGGVGPVNLVQGCIDEVRIWKTGLTGETISDWMYREVDYTHPDYADLADYYKLNEGTGTLINDEQGIVNGTFKNGLVSHWKDSGIRGWSTKEDTAFTGRLAGSRANGSSNDGSDWKLDFNVTEQGSKGVAVIIGDNSYTYTPNENVSGIDTFNYTASDGEYVSEEASVNVIINAVNDAPGQPAAFTFPAPGQVLQGGSVVNVAWDPAADIDGDALSYTDDFYNGSNWSAALQ